MTTKNCRRCGNEFTATNNAQAYCALCQKEKRKKPPRAVRTAIDYVCAWCGTRFTSDRKKRYCCRDCQVCAHRGKPKERKKSTNFMSIEEVAKASKEMGISAGEYMTKYCYGKEG